MKGIHHNIRLGTILQHWKLWSVFLGLITLCVYLLYVFTNVPQKESVDVSHPTVLPTAKRTLPVINYGQGGDRSIPLQEDKSPATESIEDIKHTPPDQSLPMEKNEEDSQYTVQVLLTEKESIEKRIDTITSELKERLIELVDTGNKGLRATREIQYYIEELKEMERHLMITGEYTEKEIDKLLGLEDAEQELEAVKRQYEEAEEEMVSYRKRLKQEREQLTSRLNEIATLLSDTEQ